MSLNAGSSAALRSIQRTRACQVLDPGQNDRMEMLIWSMTNEDAELFAIAPKSAIVSCAVSGMEALCHVEGNLYDATNLQVFADRVMHAAGRLRTGYPTSAVRSIPRKFLIPIGSWDEDAGEVRFSERGEETLAAWLGLGRAEAVSQAVTASSLRHEAARSLASLDATPQGRMQANWLRTHGPAPYRSQ